MIRMDALKIRTARATAARHQQHTAGCDKPFGTCPLCTAAITWYDQLPPHILSKVLEESA